MDDSVDLERVLRTGQAPLSVPSLRSPGSSSTSSESHPASPRPKLSDALLHVGFSPKRPRKAQSPKPFTNAASHAVNSRPGRRVSTSHEPKQPVPGDYFSPAQQSISYAAVDPEVKVQPPTPASCLNQSKFTRAARGVVREIEAEQGRRKEDMSRPVQSTIRQSDGDKTQTRQYVIDNIAQHTSEGARPQPHQNGRQKKAHLPDVTGLTSAVGTPLRAISQFYRYVPESDGDGEG